MSVPFLIFSLIAVVIFSGVSAHMQSKKRKEAIEQSLKTATFPVGAYIVGSMGRTGFAVDKGLSQLLIIEANESGGVAKKQLSIRRLAAARITQGGRTIASISRGGEIVEYPSTREIITFVERVRDTAFDHVDAHGGSPDGSPDMAFFFRTVAEMYLRQERGIQFPTEAQIQDIYARLNAKHNRLEKIGIEVDVYPDGRTSPTVRHVVELIDTSGFQKLKGETDNTAVGRARRWQHWMNQAVQQADTRTAAATKPAPKAPALKAQRAESIVEPAYDRSTEPARESARAIEARPTADARRSRVNERQPAQAGGLSAQGPAAAASLGSAESSVRASSLAVESVGAEWTRTSADDAPASDSDAAAWAATLARTQAPIETPSESAVIAPTAAAPSTTGSTTAARAAAEPSAPQTPQTVRAPIDDAVPHTLAADARPQTPSPNVDDSQDAYAALLKNVRNADASAASTASSADADSDFDRAWAEQRAKVHGHTTDG